MKSFALILRWLTSIDAPPHTRNVRVVVRLLMILLMMVIVYSVGFHFIMETEDQKHSWPTAVYWVMVTMSTLGFGDITFKSDLGRFFSVVVLLSGSTFILVLLPFTFIQFVFLPRMEAKALARAPRRLPEDTAGHVILTGIGPVEDVLIRRLEQAEIPYVVLVADVQEALALHDRGYRVMVGSPDDPDTYERAQASRATMVAATRADMANTNVVFTVRESAPSVDIVAFASADASVDILRLAGCNEVLQLGKMLGVAFARRVVQPDTDTHVIGEIENLRIAEASVIGTPLIGQTVGESRLRELLGVNVVGVWTTGTFAAANTKTVIEERSVLVLAGSNDQLRAYDDRFANASPPIDAPVIIIGGGRVGRACGAELAAAGLDYRIIEQDEKRIRDSKHYVLGDAARIEVLQAAGIERAPAVIITTHDDDANVYLSIYCRRLRPDAQVLARSNVDRNVSTLHRAGADVVLSYASSGATAIWNRLQPDSRLLLAEGLTVIREQVPRNMVGRSLADLDLSTRTGCSVVAVRTGGRLESNPDPQRRLAAGDELLLIGDTMAEQRFHAEASG